MPMPPPTAAPTIVPIRWLVSYDVTALEEDGYTVGGRLEAGNDREGR